MGVGALLVTFPYLLPADRQSVSLAMRSGRLTMVRTDQIEYVVTPLRRESMMSASDDASRRAMSENDLVYEELGGICRRSALYSQRISVRR